MSTSEEYLAPRRYEPITSNLTSGQPLPRAVFHLPVDSHFESTFLVKIRPNSSLISSTSMRGMSFSISSKCLIASCASAACDTCQAYSVPAAPWTPSAQTAYPLPLPDPPTSGPHDRHYRQLLTAQGRIQLTKFGRICSLVRVPARRAPWLVPSHSTLPALSVALP